MPFNPFTNLTGKNACTLFEIRLDDDFIVFRGNDHEAAGQMLKGNVVLCLPSPLKIEDIHLRLTGQLRLAWTDSRPTPSGISTQRIDHTKVIFNHRWDPFVSPPVGSSSKSLTLPAGNYEWPFELLLPGSTAESVEGLPETSLTYKLKATIARGKLAYDLHAHKHLRIIRTLEPAALEFLHAMSVENVWVNKIEYSIVIPQKAIVFGGKVPLDMRFTPLLKGLEMGDITVKLMEIQDFILQGHNGRSIREHRHEREAHRWVLNINREEHWQDMLDETGQEGWVVHSALPLPKKLRECVQDVNSSGIKIRHKLRLNVALKNPDGHVSELRATLPITIFISPNMLLDDQGNLIRQHAGAVSPLDVGAVAPPGYGEHILDQLYDDVPTIGFQSPPLQSGVNTPFYAQSRAGSADNLSNLASGITPAALSSRLQNMAAMNLNSGTLGAQSNPLDQPNRNPSLMSGTELSRRTSNEDDDSTDSPNGIRHARSGHHTPEHIDFPAMDDLSRVPSYATAVRTPARHLAVPNGNAPPDYRVAISMSAPSSVCNRDTDPLSTSGMETIHEVTSTNSGEWWPSRRRRRDSGSSGVSRGSGSSGNMSTRQTRPLSANNSEADRPISRSGFSGRSRAVTLGLGFLNSHLHIGDSDERGRLYLIQARERVM